MKRQLLRYEETPQISGKEYKDMRLPAGRRKKKNIKNDVYRRKKR